MGRLGHQRQRLGSGVSRLRLYRRALALASAGPAGWQWRVFAAQPALDEFPRRAPRQPAVPLPRGRCDRPALPPGARGGRVSLRAGRGGGAVLVRARPPELPDLWLPRSAELGLGAERRRDRCAARCGQCLCRQENRADRPDAQKPRRDPRLAGPPMMIPPELLYAVLRYPLDRFPWPATITEILGEKDLAVLRDEARPL